MGGQPGRALSIDERARLIYDVYDEIADRELGDEMRDLELTPEIVEEIVAEVAWTYTRARNARPAVRALLTTPSRSPHIDWIAVERAAAFDWDVFEALTDLERGALAELLAARPNPTDAPGGGITNRHRQSVHYRPSQRRNAYLSGTEEQRHRMLALIDRRGHAQASAA